MTDTRGQIPIATKIGSFMEAGSWIRKMFEEGAAMKKIHGADNVFDFSLGNPMGEPPAPFLSALKKALDDPTPGKHGYMPNAGYADVRATLAAALEAEHGVPLTAEHLIMTVGAAGALNVILKALVNPGDTVLIFAPYFVEYKFYIDNVGGVCEVVETDASFNLDLDAIAAALTPGVRAMIINTPNNPTGRVYPRDTLEALGKLVNDRAAAYGHPIYILSDEPYKRIVYDNHDVPCLFHVSPYTIVCTSYSKELSVPGERIGYLAINPCCPHAGDIINAATFCNRILGFVNAPALMQRALGLSPHARVDTAGYAENRALLLRELSAMGYDIVAPEGAFYLFPRSPIPDEVVFVDELKKENILVVPGRGFGRSGYFRISYCVTRQVIEKALPGFKRAMDRATR